MDFLDFTLPAFIILTMNVQHVLDTWLKSRLPVGLRQSTVKQYEIVCRDFCRHFGHRDSEDLSPPDFRKWLRSMRDRMTDSTISNRVKVIRSAFRWAQEEELCPMPRMGGDFRRFRQSPPLRLTFDDKECQLLLQNCCPTLFACCLMGLNAGFGNADCWGLRHHHILGDMVDMPRPKTGIERRACLWPETIGAVERAGLPFGGRLGPFPRPESIGKLFRSLCSRLGIYQPKRTFYSLRRTYRTAVDEHLDRPAIDMTMGHTTPGMGSRYVASISDDRLRVVSFLARKRLFRDAIPPAPKTESARDSGMRMCV